MHFLDYYLLAGMALLIVEIINGTISYAMDEFINRHPPLQGGCYFILRLICTIFGWPLVMVINWACNPPPSKK
jgi:hypothetical protein